VAKLPEMATKGEDNYLLLRVILEAAKGIRWLSNCLGLAAGLLCLLMGLIVAFDVFARYLFRNPFPWAWEVNNCLLLAITFLGGAFTLLIDGHVKVDVIYSRFSFHSQAIVDVCTSVFVLSYLLWFDFLVWGAALKAFRTGETSNLMFWPLFPIKLLLPIGTSLLILVFLVKLGEKIAVLRKG